MNIWLVGGALTAAALVLSRRGGTGTSKADDEPYVPSGSPFKESSYADLPRDYKAPDVAPLPPGSPPRPNWERARANCLARCERAVGDCDDSFWDNQAECESACQAVYDQHMATIFVDPVGCFSAITSFDDCVARTRDCDAFEAASRGTPASSCTQLDYARSDACIDAEWEAIRQQRG